MGLADSREEEAEEVIDLGDRPDGAAGILVGRLLFDGNNGAQAGDLVHIGSFHIPDELPGIGPKTFHIAALAFGVDGVEGEGGFSAAADAGDDDQLVLRNADVDVLKIVYPRAGYVDHFFFFRDGCPAGSILFLSHSAKVNTTIGMGG